MSLSEALQFTSLSASRFTSRKTTLRSAFLRSARARFMTHGTITVQVHPSGEVYVPLSTIAVHILLSVIVVHVPLSTIVVCVSLSAIVVHVPLSTIAVYVPFSTIAVYVPHEQYSSCPSQKHCSSRPFLHQDLRPARQR